MYEVEDMKALAINNSDKDIIQLLLLAGGVVDARYRGYDRAIKRAIRCADVDMVRILLPHYAPDINGRQRFNKMRRVAEMEIRSLEKEKALTRQGPDCLESIRAIMSILNGWLLPSLQCSSIEKTSRTSADSSSLKETTDDSADD
jgi:hypothetical protein